MPFRNLVAVSITFECLLPSVPSAELFREVRLGFIFGLIFAKCISLSVELVPTGQYLSRQCKLNIFT